jgi:hypothetical protein
VSSTTLVEDKGAAHTGVVCKRAERLISRVRISIPFQHPIHPPETFEPALGLVVFSTAFEQVDGRHEKSFAIDYRILR